MDAIQMAVELDAAKATSYNIVISSDSQASP